MTSKSFSLSDMCIAFVVFAEAVNYSILYAYLVVITANDLQLSIADADLNVYAGLAACVLPLAKFFSNVFAVRLFSG
jgi:hypothetical protein